MRLRSKRQKPQPINPLREWVGLDGEERVALHPLYAGLGHFYAPDKSGLEGIRVCLDRLKEIATGERRLPDEVAQTMFEWDREQQANGCPDENIVGLVEVLRGAS